MFPVESAMRWLAKPPRGRSGTRFHQRVARACVFARGVCRYTTCTLQNKTFVRTCGAQCGISNSALAKGASASSLRLCRVLQEKHLFEGMVIFYKSQCLLLFELTLPACVTAHLQYHSSGLAHLKPNIPDGSGRTGATNQI